jgi:RND family efflux transporter MFP subunit
VQVDDDLLQAQLAAAQASYQTSKTSLERYQSASSGGGVSQLQLDNLDLTFKNAEAQVTQLLKQISLSKLIAPFTGTITFKDVEVGSVIGNAAVARISDLSRMKLEISVPEKEIGMFKEGDEVVVSTDVYQDKAFSGIVCYVADRADNAHNYAVKMIIKNEDKAARLKAGMYGRASVHKSLNHNAILIPRSALLGSAKNPQVFVIEDSTARLRSIQTGDTNGLYVQVTSGLSLGNYIVTGGQINLTEGTKVEIVK